jgi:hypothetical protein
LWLVILQPENTLAARLQEHTNTPNFQIWICGMDLVSMIESSSNSQRAFFSLGGQAITRDLASPLDAPSLLDAPHPVLLNSWKHHAAVLRLRIRRTIGIGPAALDDLAGNLVVIGTELMDLYLGTLSPRAIGEGLLAELRRDGHVSLDAYRAWIADNRGYRVQSLPADGTEWVLRLGDATGRWMHVHPARWTPKTCRVKANVLKTAVMILAYTGIHGGDPMDLALVNQVRCKYLELAPLGRGLAGDQGIGQTINLLRDPDEG